MLLGALSLCLGTGDSRGSRRDTDLRATAVFRHGSTETAFTRESGSGGRLRGSIDGLATSAEGLRSRSAELIVIHGQHDSLRLRGRSEALRLIDAFGGIDDGDLQAVRAQRRELASRRERYGGDPDAREREVEFLRYQLDEINSIAITSPDELTETLGRLRELTALRDHFEDLVSSARLLDGDSDDAVLVRWSEATSKIPRTGRFDDIRTRLEDIALEARDLVHDLSRRTDEMELSPAEIERLDGRAATLQAIARKYGGTLDQVLVRRDDLAHDLLTRESEAQELEGVDAALDEVGQREASLAARLFVERSRAAQEFATAVAAQFERVALAQSSLAVTVGGDDGSVVELLFSPNPGLAGGPLNSLASGGELSRVLLAISLVTVSDGVVAVFDEIDSGVGGSVAQQIGECLAELASRQQVIVVTHLASVAARADRHFVVAKTSSDGSTNVEVRAVDGEQRVSEIARMLAGQSEQRESRALAERLLATP